jgi:hypothetical protein
MSTTVTEERVSPFRWNAGAWFGSQLGGTLWLLVGAGVLLTWPPLASSVWAASFVLANALGLTLWANRGRLGMYVALQTLMIGIGLACQHGGRRLVRPAPGPDDRLPEPAPDGLRCPARHPGNDGVVLVQGAAWENGERREGSTVKHQVSADDQAFRTQFEAGKFPPGEFNHRAHVRLAYVYLADHDTEAAHRLMQQALLNFLCHNGVDVSKYHETMTRAWIMAVRHFMESAPACESSDAFVESNPRMLDSRIMMTHYSAELLLSEEARARFVEPNLSPIPRY